MNDIVNKKIEKLTELEKKLKDYEDAKFTTKISSTRGRIIRELEKIVKELESKEDKNEEEIEALEKYKDQLGDELFKHKLQLKNRYDSEFLHGPAKVPDVVTTLPKGVTLQVRKVANVINEIKNAKGTKARAVATANLAKEVGLLAATPFIFTGKFVIEHWYLLALLFKGDLLNWLKKFIKNKGKDDTQVEREPAEETVSEELRDTVPDTVREPALNIVKDPVNNPVKIPAKNSIPDKINEIVRNGVSTPVQSPVNTTINGTQQVKVGVNGIITDPAKNPLHDKIDTILKKPVNVPSNDSINIDPNTSGVQIKPGITNGINQIDEDVKSLEGVSEDVLHRSTTTDLTTEELEAREQVYNETLANFQERSNGQVFIKGISTQNPDVIVCRTPKEYLEKICDLCGEDYNAYLTESGEISRDGYQRMIDFNIGRFGQDTRLDEVVFSDPEGAYYEDFVNSGVISDDNMYSRFRTLQYFDSVDEFEEAIVSGNPIYDDIRNHFEFCTTVSEAQEAVQTLISMGVLTAGSGAVSWLLGLDVGGGILLSDAALIASAPEGNETIYEIVKYIIELVKKDPVKAADIFVTPVPALSF